MRSLSTNRTRRFFRILPFYFFLFAFYFFSGCMRYSFSGAVPGHLKTVAVPLFENQTAEYGVVERITDKVIQDIQRDNTLKITDENSADSILRGTLLRIEDTPYTYSGQEQVQSYSVGEYKLTLTVQITYSDQTKGEDLWTQEFRAWGTYNYVTGAPGEREEGFQEAIDKLAEDILNQTVSGW